MPRKKFKLSLVLLPIILIIIIEANSEYTDESRALKGRLAISDSNNGPPDQDNDNPNDHDHPPSFGPVQQFTTGRVMIPSSALTSNQMQWGPQPILPQFHSIRIGPDGAFGDSAGNQRKKKDCGFPVLTRRLIGPIMKRAQRDLPYFANSEDEIQEKSKEEDSSLARIKRDSETHSGGCLAKRQWIDMGADYYPRYVKSYHCSSNTCDRGFGVLGECKPKHYTTKVLKRITPADTTSVEDCDQTLPEALRVDWKLISVTVTTCCDCVSPGRLFGRK